MQTASGYILYYTLVPCHYAFAPFLCMYTPVVYSGIMVFTLYIYDAPNKLFKDKKKSIVELDFSELSFSRISECTTGYTFTPCVGSFTSPGIDTR